MNPILKKKLVIRPVRNMADGNVVYFIAPDGLRGICNR